MSDRSRDWFNQAQALVYTSEEWETMARTGGRFYRTLLREARWVYERETAPDPSLAEEETDAPTRPLAG
ncbi:MAG: hypothetical protein HY784_05350 [Chloroflexi bacterium]|nr:hypothetical protein [Chloroflexota bacterium]